MRSAACIDVEYIEMAKGGNLDVRAGPNKRRSLRFQKRGDEGVAFRSQPRTVIDVFQAGQFPPVNGLV